MAALFIGSHSSPRIDTPLSHVLCTLNSKSYKTKNKKFPCKAVSCSRKNHQEGDGRYVLSFGKHPFGQKSERTLHFLVSKSRKYVPCSVDEEQESRDPTSISSVAVVDEKPGDGNEGEKESTQVEASKKEDEELEKQQEKDWKTDEEFKKFMGNPSIEAAIKLEKKRADTKLKELDRESTDNPIMRLFNRLVRDSLTREKERLEKAEESFKALDLNKVTYYLQNYHLSSCL